MNLLFSHAILIPLTTVFSSVLYSSSRSIQHTPPGDTHSHTPFSHFFSLLISCCLLVSPCCTWKPTGSPYVSFANVLRTTLIFI